MDILETLKKKILFQWKVQSFNSDKTLGSVVGYIDSRDAMKLLDEAVPFKWQDKYRMEGTRLICSVGIKIDNEWIWREDTGSEADIEAEKSLVSDAFKRACVKWGIGRFLYDEKIKWVDINSNKKPLDKDGKVLWTPEDLTNYINNGGGYDKPFKPNTSTTYKKPQESKPSESQTPNQDNFKSEMGIDNKTICEDCKTPISEKVASFSQSKFKKSLCMDCQHKN